MSKGTETASSITADMSRIKYLSDENARIAAGHVPSHWPLNCGAYHDFCRDRDLFPGSPASEAEFAEAGEIPAGHDGFCIKCGEPANMAWTADEDVSEAWGQRQWATTHAPNGSECCHAPLVRADGEDIDLPEVRL